MECDIYAQEYASVRQLMVCRLTGRINQEASGTQALHRRVFADLEMIPCLYYKGTDGTAKTGPVLLQHQENWGVTQEQLMNDAAENMRRILPPRLYRMDDLMKSRMNGSVRNVLTSLLKQRFPDTQTDILDQVSVLLTEQIVEKMQKNSGLKPMWVLSNDAWIYGASGLLFDDVLEQFANEQECGVFILPSSVNEVIFLPGGGNEDTAQMQEMVSNANCKIKDRDKILSDSVYYYDRQRKQIFIL